VAGSGGLIKEGSGTQTLTGTNTFTGGTTINAGTLAIGAGGSLAATGAVTWPTPVPPSTSARVVRRRSVRWQAWRVRPWRWAAAR
jgi:autotransporter-associated beta strand protein